MRRSPHTKCAPSILKPILWRMSQHQETLSKSRIEGVKINSIYHFYDFIRLTLLSEMDDDKKRSAGETDK